MTTPNGVPITPITVREVCRCGHSKHLHYSNRYACGLRYSWTSSTARLDTHRARPGSCPCMRYRPARWTDEHSLLRHLTVRLWWALSDDQRYALCGLYDRITRERRCWCDIIDAALQADPDWRADYRGPLSCACDAPLPWDAGKPIPGRCYCPPWRTER